MCYCGNYPVLARISISCELRVFCAIFLAQICVRAIFLRFSISETDERKNNKKFEELKLTLRLNRLIAQSLKDMTV